LLFQPTWTGVVNSVIPTPIPEKSIVSLNNQSSFTVISAEVIVINNKTNTSSLYKLYAESPIEPLTIGTLSGQSNLGVVGDQFSKDYTWNFRNVWGISK
jgi:hypothetical protein